MPDILEKGCWSNSSTWQNFIIGKLRYLQRDLKSQFLINGFEQGVGSRLEYYLRVEIVEYSVRAYRDFMK